MSVKTGINNARIVFGGILGIGLVGLLFLIVFGNLSGNLGFTALSQGANDTNAVIGNLTSGAVGFFSFANTWFILSGVVLLIVIVLAVIGLVTKKTSGGGFSG